MFITLEMLESKDACYSQLDLFQERFPEGIEVTKEACVLVADKFDWDWAAKNLLPKEDKKAYQEATDTARKAYHEADDTAWKAYQEATDTAWKAYQEATDTARKAYQEAMAFSFGSLTEKY
jgi:hypothetical protein